jgi:transcriptional regulator with XRE-family HTH domain
MKLRLKEILKKKGQSISAFADQVGIAQANMSNIVNGKTSPSLDTIERIAEALELPVADLFITGDISGFLKYQGDIFEVRSVQDIEGLLNKIKSSKE